MLPNRSVINCGSNYIIQRDSYRILPTLFSRTLVYFMNQPHAIFGVYKRVPITRISPIRSNNHFKEFYRFPLFVTHYIIVSTLNVK